MNADKPKVLIFVMFPLESSGENVTYSTSVAITTEASGIFRICSILKVITNS